MALKVMIIGGQTFGAAAARVVGEMGHRIVAVAGPEGDAKMAAIVDEFDARWVGPDLVAGRVPAGTDVILAVHNHLWVPDEVVDATRLGAISYHPSLLPRHRGKDAVRWQVHMRDQIAGGTVYWMDGGVDKGPIAAQDWCWLDPSWDASTLWREKLFPMGLDLVGRVMLDLDMGNIIKMPQDERFATWEPSMDRPKLRESWQPSSTLVPLDPGEPGYSPLVAVSAAARESGTDAEGDLPSPH